MALDCVMSSTCIPGFFSIRIRVIISTTPKKLSQPGIVTRSSGTYWDIVAYLVSVALNNLIFQFVNDTVTALWLQVTSEYSPFLSFLPVLSFNLILTFFIYLPNYYNHSDVNFFSICYVHSDFLFLCTSLVSTFILI